MGYNPVEPASFLTRLQTIGYGDITVSLRHGGMLFQARKPEQ